MTGIDISKYQPFIPAGSWEFIISRATHDATGLDDKFAEHFAQSPLHARVRGAYHYANPRESSAVAQATHFARVCIGNGFRKGVDLWALDSEGDGMRAGAFTVNAAWVREFFATARTLLGDRALWYVGWPYYVEHFGASLVLLHEQAWWLPSYGSNNGEPHDPKVPYTPVLHQYTSRGGPGGTGLDVNRVLDAVGWQRLISASSAPAPTTKVRPVISATHPPVDANVVGGHVAVLTSDGGVFFPHGGSFKGSPVGKPYWKGRVAAALGVKGDPQHPLTAAEVKAGVSYAVIATSGERYAF